MRYFVSAFSALMVAVLLAGCGPKVIYRDRVVTVDRPVPQPCAGERPVPVAPLRERFADDVWKGMDVRQKAAAVGKHAGDLRGHSEALNAATAECP